VQNADGTDRARLAAVAPGTLRYVTSPRIAYEYDDFFAGNELFKFDVELLDEFFPKPGRLLDLGCGTGRHVVGFARRGFDVTGVDLSAFMINESAEKLRAEGLDAELIHGNVMDLREIAPGPFDYAICMFSTLGMIDTQAHRLNLVRAIAGSLRDGGLLALHVHNRFYNLFFPQGRLWLVRNAFEAALGLCEAGDKVTEYRGVAHFYLHIFSLREIRRLLRAGGFDVVREVCLNDARDGEFGPRVRFRRIRANGFVVLARKCPFPGT